MARRRVRRAARAIAVRTVQAVRSVPARVRRRASSARQAVSSGIVLARTSQGRRRIARQAAVGLVRGGSALTIAQLRIAPAAVGGYLIAKVERNQRLAHAEKVNGKGKGAFIENPQTRILAELGLIAFAASRVQGYAREALCGAAGALGAIYETYSADLAGNPVDRYLVDVRSGGAGI